LMEKAQAQLGKMREKAKQIRETLDKADNEGLHRDDCAELGQIEGAAAELEQAIENARAGDAQGKASQVAEGAEGLGEEIGESEARELDRQRLGELREAMQHLEEAGQAARELAAELAGMQPGPGEGLTPGEGQRLGQLGREQREISERVQQLQEKMQELESESPGDGQPMNELLEGAKQAMGEAEGELEGKRPKSAQEKQQEALEKLQEAQQELDRRMQQQQQKGQNDQ